MSKRDFSTMSNDDATHEAVSQIVQQAEELLRAAIALKTDLDVGKHLDKAATDHLSAIACKILPAVDSLSLNPSARKLPKRDDGSPKPSLISIPLSTTLPPWSPQDVPSPHSPLPSLPPILDPVLEKAALTHSGMVQNTGEMSYERLEWLGDAYLYLMSSSLIYQTFPDLPAGRCSQYRELLIRNKTLSTYSQGYQLDKRARFPPEFNLEGGSGGSSATASKKKKALGDIFEAYVAGVILGDSTQGLSTVAAWMKSLWSRELVAELQAEFKRSRRTPGQPTPDGAQDGSGGRSSFASQPQRNLDPKVHLSHTIGAKGIKITYRDEGEPKRDKKSGLPRYTVGVYLDGWGMQNYRMGFASALSKREAGAKAAQIALDNKKMMNGFQQKKKEFLAAIEAQQEYAEWNS
ncbi:ribonuclease III domain-containing protein [Xylariales sp. PMI_506]|nr:ribonuclease III domain-containing protein [Xylariales sp. PMI_506]